MSCSVPPPYRRFVRMSPRLTVIENDELKYFELAEPPAARQIDGREVDRLEVQPVGDHQLHAVPCGRRRSSGGIRRP